MRDNKAPKAPTPEEIRETYDEYVEAWKDIREQGRIDMKYQTDPWPSDERAARSKKGEERPIVVFDEVQQYTNQIVNDVLLNKRAIKINPEGSGADGKSAQFRQARIRQIEYKSNAQAAYATAFEGAVTRSYGYAGWTTQYCDDDCVERELLIRRFQNPDAVLLDPHAKEVDCSDGLGAFVLDYVRRKSFGREWKEAKVKDFNADHLTGAPAWITKDYVLVAEFWKVHLIPRTLFVTDNAEQPKIYQDELSEGERVVPVEPYTLPNGVIVDSMLLASDGSRRMILNQRKTETRKVVQYITNGLEILETNPWDGKWIPIVPCFGREVFIDEGSGSKRQLFSAVRKARDPILAYCYGRSAQLEIIAMTSKTPYMGYEGQFSSPNADWKNIHKIPMGFVEFKGKTEATGEALLPPPRRESYEPAIQALEMFCEAARRATQAAMGQTSLPTAAQRQNQKSGVALERIESQMARGSYHFLNNYDRFLEHMGRIGNDLLDKIEDTARDVGIRKPDDTHEVVRIHETVVDQDSGEEKLQTYGEGKYGITISTGPSFQSEREEASAFADSLVQTPNLVAMAIQGAGVAPKILAKAIRLRNLGPMGDSIADDIDPPAKEGQAPLPPQAVEQMKALSQQIQQLQVYAQQLQEKLGELQAEKQAKMLDNRQKLDIVREQERSRLEIAQLQEETKRVLAEITASCQEAKCRLDNEQRQWELSRGHAHERGMQAVEHLHDMETAESAAQEPPVEEETPA